MYSVATSPTSRAHTGQIKVTGHRKGVLKVVQKRAERLEGRCRRLQAEFEAAAAKAKAAETRASEAGAAAAARNSDAVAERESELSALKVAQRNAQRDAAQAAAAAERAERREAAALAQVCNFSAFLSASMFDGCSGSGSCVRIPYECEHTPNCTVLRLA